MMEHHEATAICAVPAEPIGGGFRLLVMRELREDGVTPAYAFIEQRLLRSPERRNRHGISFALTFRPEVMNWLIEALGRPSARDGEGRAQANPSWPRLAWFHAERCWPDGVNTIEWFADIAFHDEASRAHFAQAWQARLMGDSEAGSET